MTITAKALHEKLAELGLPNDKINDLVKAAGIDPEPVVDPSALDAAIDLIKGSMEDDSALDDILADVSPSEDGAGAAMEIAKAADRMLQATEVRWENLAKGVLAHGKLTQQVAAGISTLTDLVADVTAQVSVLQKGLGQPVAPRAVSDGTQVIPHPADGLTGESDAPDPVALRAKMIAKATSELREGATQNRAYSLQKAMADLDAGFHPSVVNSNYSVLTD